MPIKNNQTAYQRLQENLDYKLDQMNKAKEAAFNAVNRPATSSRPSGKTKADVYNNTVRRQRQLQKMGFYHGAIDGDWKGKSERAHQAALNNGYMLNSYGMYVKKPQADKRAMPDAVDPVRMQQAQLKQLGFYKGKVDGKFWDNSKKAHQAALDAGYRYENGQYIAPQKAPEKQLGLLDRIENNLLKAFPAVRQIRNSVRSTGSGYTQTNKDFSDKYLENLSQLGQVAYRRYVREHGYPKPGELFPMSLTPEVYMEINPSGKYASFKDLPALLNAMVGGNRQVEYTDGGMSGTAYIGNDGNVHWNATDNAAWDFDSPEQIERLKDAASSGHPGSAVRYGMGKLQEKQNNAGYEPIKQNLNITFPLDTISVNPARYDNVPRYKQKK